jgi:hypothetical protein
MLFKKVEERCQILAAQYYVSMYLEYDEKLHAVNHPSCKKYVAYVLGGCYQGVWGGVAV